MKASAIALSVWLLTGCASTPLPDPARSVDTVPILTRWSSFVRYIQSLQPSDLEFERDLAIERYQTLPNDLNRLRLAYLLSRPRLPEPEPSRSQALLAEIDTSSELAALRDLVGKELALLSELDAHRQQVDKLKGRVQALNSQVQGLQAQLNTLRTIETDINDTQRELEELPNEPPDNRADRRR